MDFLQWQSSQQPNWTKYVTLVMSGDQTNNIGQLYNIHGNTPLKYIIPPLQYSENQN